MQKVETGESLPGAKVVLLDKTRKELTAQQAEIVSVGLPGICDDDSCERPHRFHAPLLKPNNEGHWHHFGGQAGDWVLLVPRSLTEGPDNCYFVNQDDVLAVLSQ